MATASLTLKAPIDSARPISPVVEGASISPHYVFNTHSTTAQDNPLDPFNIASDTAGVPDSEAAKVIRVVVPALAKYLVLSHAWAILADPGTDTDPTTLPIVRVFGRLPGFSPSSQAATPFQSANTSGLKIPGNLAAVQPPFLTLTEDWHALSNLNTGEYTLQLGSTSAPTSVWEYTNDDGDIYRRSATKTIHLRGCAEIMVTVSTAAVGPTSGAIIGTFEY